MDEILETLKILRETLENSPSIPVGIRFFWIGKN